MVSFALLLLIAAIISLWFNRDPKIWGTLLAASILASLFVGFLSVNGLAWCLLLAFFWVSYNKEPRVGWFLTIVVLSLALKVHLLPGFYPLFLTPRFALGLTGMLIGLFPLALVVPLSRSMREWRGALKGAALGCAGIAVMAILAIASQTVTFDCKMPSFMAARTISNLFFTSIPEEAFFRGFLQNNLCRAWGKSAGLLVTSAIFTATHIFWSPNLEVLGFVFLAGLLYGGVYLWSGRIESAIATHFLLNLIHYSCFSYHAM